jgi:hypothetical protein
MTENNQRCFLWSTVILAPLFFMLGSYYSDHWTWGLMDDTGFLDLSGAWWTRVWEYHQSLIRWGTCRIVSAMYIQTFYPIFNDAPKAFYVFHLLWSIGTLFIWGLSAHLLTQKKSAIFLVPAVSLTYYFYYDTFSYLAISEPVGLFFTSIMTYCLFKGGIVPLSNGGPLRWGWLTAGFVSMVFGIQGKELFVSVPLAVGVILLIASIIKKRFRMSLFSGSMIVLVVGFALYLKFSIQGVYTSKYSMTDLPKITQNLWIWVRHSLVFHVPWLILMGVALVMRWRDRCRYFFEVPLVWGWAAAFLLYCLSGLLLLPWQVTDFYALPLGVFFGLGASIFLARFLDDCPPVLFGFILVGALAMAVFVCGQSFGKMTAYRNDTAFLIDWLVHNRQ